MSMTLSERFQNIADFKLSVKATAVNIYRVQEDNIGDNKVISAVAEKEINLYELVSLIMTAELYRKYRKYRNYYVVAECHDGDVYKVWIAKNS